MADVSPATGTLSVAFVVGGTTFEVPPLSIWSLRHGGAWDAIGAVGRPQTPVELASSILRVVEAGLAISRPDVTLETLEQLATLSDLDGLNVSLLRLLDVSGLRRSTTPGEPEATTLRTGTAS
jgi:hypothetical protein